MKLSIIICVFNMEDYIDRCIASVVRQTSSEFEVILINDGSTDGTLDKCKKWEKTDSRIKLVDKSNEGLGISRNRGICMASGEYLTFLDADDWLEDEFVEVMLRGTQDGRNDIVICDMCFVEITDESEQRKISSVRLPDGNVDIENEGFLLSRARTFMCAKLIRKKLFEENNLLLPAHAFEDVSVVPYLIAKASHIHYVHKAMYYYWRNRGGSIVNDFSQLLYTIISLEELIDRFKMDNIFNKYQKALANLFWGQVCHIWNVTRGKFSNSDEDAIKYVREAAANNFCKFFPEGATLLKSKYYVDGPSILFDSIKHIVLSDKQIICKPSQADYIIISDNNTKKLQGYVEKKQRLLLVTVDSYEYEEEETTSWNVADEMFELILESN